ncbi:hypothetical protein VBD025_15855 [Virgibacillus flavescens]|uniref:hypothetical protein n=1 Tax=Virgibacillus flavescens TaxID=1611422 RepID=UPI003D340295
MKEVYGTMLSQDEANELRRYLVDEKLRNNGENFAYSHTVYPGDEKKTIQFQLIEYANWTYEGHKNKEINLRLSEKGIELLFKTKEMFSEMQISITALFLKQQLEKGEFAPALNAAKDLIFQIDSQRNSIDRYSEKIRRNAISALEKDRLNQTIENSTNQTKQEKEQINDLRKNIDEIKMNYINGVLTKRERKKYETILQIDSLLDSCNSKIAILFTKKLDLSTTARSSVELLIENLFAKKFNFEQAVLQNWVTKRVTQEKAHKLLKPIMPVKYPKTYHPMWAFKTQTVKKVNHNLEKMLPELSEEEKEAEILKLKQQEEKDFQNFKRMAEYLLLPLIEKEYYFISDVLKDLRENNLSLYSELENQDFQLFLDTVMALHFNTYKQFEMHDLDEIAHDPDENKVLISITNENDELEDIGGFLIVETEKEFEFANGAMITDFIILRKEKKE